MTNIVATVLTTLVFAAGFFPFAVAGYLGLTRNGRARHHWAAFVASRTTVHTPAATAPPTPKEFPMRKIFLFCLAAAALIGVMAMTTGCSATPAATQAAAPAAVVVEPVVATVCADVVATGEASHAAYTVQRQAGAAADVALDALLADSNYGTPEHDVLQTAVDEANAAHALANADVTTASGAYSAAKMALPDAAARSACRSLTELDLEFLNAHSALQQATDTTRPAAQAKWDAAQAKWDAAKTS
jgi:hypothetical protein